MDEKSNTQEHLIAFAKRKKTLIVLTFSFFLVFIVVATVIMIAMGGSNYQNSKIPEEYLDGFYYFRNTLKDPSSFVLCGDVMITTPLDDSDSISIGFRYNANNSYGAKGGINSGLLMRANGKWEYFSNDQISTTNEKPGEHPLESSYNYILERIKESGKELEQIKSGKVKVEEKEQKKIEKAHNDYLKKKDTYHTYDGKKVAETLDCEYYEYK